MVPSSPGFSWPSASLVSTPPIAMKYPSPAGMSTDGKASWSVRSVKIVFVTVSSDVSSPRHRGSKPIPDPPEDRTVHPGGVDDDHGHVQELGFRGRLAATGFAGRPFGIRRSGQEPLFDRPHHEATATVWVIPFDIEGKKLRPGKIELRKQL